MKRVCGHFHTMRGRLSGVCGLGWVNFEGFGTFCTFLKVPAGITVSLVWSDGVLDRSWWFSVKVYGYLWIFMDF